MPIQRKCCCTDGLYVGCYCPTITPDCVSGLTHAEIAALEVFPYEFEDSLNKICSDIAVTKYRCIGRTHPTLGDMDCEDFSCPPVSSIVYTGSWVGNQGALNCEAKIDFGTHGLGTCLLFDRDYSIVWTAGTCAEIYSVEIESLQTGDTFETICSERNCCESNVFPTPKLCGCCSWRIIEVVDGVEYQTSETLCNIPATYTPPSFNYYGYMELQFFCEGEADWKTMEAWTTINGGPTHTFQIYDAECIDCTNLVGVTITYGMKL